MSNLHVTELGHNILVVFSIQLGRPDKENAWFQKTMRMIHQLKNEDTLTIIEPHFAMDCEVHNVGYRLAVLGKGDLTEVNSATLTLTDACVDGLMFFRCSNTLQAKLLLKDGWSRVDTEAGRGVLLGMLCEENI